MVSNGGGLVVEDSTIFGNDVSGTEIAVRRRALRRW